MSQHCPFQSRPNRVQTQILLNKGCQRIERDVIYYPAIVYVPVVSTQILKGGENHDFIEKCLFLSKIRFSKLKKNEV